jgi:hypothetical protein
MTQFLDNHPFWARLLFAFVLVLCAAFAHAQGGAGQSNYPVSTITVQNNGTNVGAANGQVYLNLVSGCTATQSGNTFAITCTGSGSGTNVTVAGGSNLATANFNATTPAAQTNFLNCTFQTSTTNVSLECPTGTTSSAFALGNILNGLTITSSSGTFTLANSKTFTVNNTLTLAGTDSSTLNIGAGGTLAALAFLTTVTSSQVDSSICSNAACGQNTTGTASNVSGTPALPNGTTGTKQTALSNDTKLATDSYVDSAVAAIGCQSGCSYMIGGENWGFVGPGPSAAYTANQYHIARFYNTNQRLLGATGCINVTTLHAGGHVDAGVYSLSGTTLTLRWHIGQQSTGATGSVCGTSLTTFTMLANTAYYLASCSDDTTALIDIIGSAPIGNQLGGANGTANTYGKDTTDACVNGTLQTTITSTNITNATTVNVPFVLVLN